MSKEAPADPLEEDLLAAVEAILFAAGEPVQPRDLAIALEGCDPVRIQEAVVRLKERYDERAGGLRVEQIAGGFRLATRPEVGAQVRQYFRQRNRTRLSPAALETLAIVAYRQPITAPEIQAIRGVDPQASLKGLLEKKLVRLMGRKKVVGNPLLYGTSKDFLVHFGLNRLSDLPSMDDFDTFLGTLEETRNPLLLEPDASDEVGVRQVPEFASSLNADGTDEEE